MYKEPNGAAGINCLVIFSGVSRLSIKDQFCSQLSVSFADLKC